MKKLLKKATVFVLCLIVLCCVTACSNKESDAKEAVVSTTPTQSTDSSNSTTGSVAGKLKGVKLKVGTSGLFAPFSYYNDGGTELIGFDLDFLKELQNLLEFQIDGEVQAMDYSALTTSVAKGKLDLAMAALCATDERKKMMNFSNTYYDSGQILCINKETSPKELKTVDMLKSGTYKVAVEKGTASHLYCTNQGIPESCLEVHDTITTAYQSLEQGKVDCLLQDTPGMAYYIKTAKDTKLEMTGDEFNQGQAPYAVAVSFQCTEQNNDIIDTINKAIEELTTNGTIDKLKDKWCK